MEGRKHSNVHGMWLQFRKRRGNESTTCFVLQETLFSCGPNLNDDDVRAVLSVLFLLLFCCCWRKQSASTGERRLGGLRWFKTLKPWD